MIGISLRTPGLLLAILALERRPAMRILVQDKLAEPIEESAEWLSHYEQAAAGRRANLNLAGSGAQVCVPSGHPQDGVAKGASSVAGP